MADPIVTEKFCNTCTQTKPASEFHRKSISKDGLSPDCKPCRSSRMKVWRATPGWTQRHRERQRAWRATPSGRASAYKRSQASQIRKELKERAGTSYIPAEPIDLEVYEQMLDDQDGRCAICRGEQKTARLSIDHCHATGKIRALLCIKCNNGLGCFRDSPTLLGDARMYLLAHAQ